MLYCPRCRQRIDPPETSCADCGGLLGEELGGITTDKPSTVTVNLPSAIDQPTQAPALDKEETGVVEPIEYEQPIPADGSETTEITSEDEQSIASIGSRTAWKCPGCGKEVPAHFELCWNCQLSESGELPSENEVEVVEEVEVVGEPSYASMPPQVEVEKVVTRPSSHCSRCGSKKVIPEVKILDRDDGHSRPLRIVIYGDPNALIFKDSYYENLVADICGDCGHVELRVANPRALYQHYLSSQK